MVTSKQCVDKYGEPDVTMERKHLEVLTVPADVRKAISALPARIYLNKDLKAPLLAAFKNIIDRDQACHIDTWDGCFNIRKKRGAKSASLHSWAIAVDINAATNAFGATPKLEMGVVKCFTDAGFDWGGTWAKKDGMHFQLSKI